MSELRLISGSALSAGKRATATRGRTLFLITASREPCGVEVFTQRLVEALSVSDPDSLSEVLSISPRVRDLPSVICRIAHADRIVWSFPLVAWKRMLIIPWILLLCTLVLRRRNTVFLHEWSALHWLRRTALTPFIALSETIVVLSPWIREQIAGDRWIGRYVRKCRIIPHPPTIRRPNERAVTDTVRRLEEAAKRADVIIGHFGSIYGGKAPTALLDICDHLRTCSIRALIVYIGSFTKSLDDYEAQFRAKIDTMGLREQVFITGYVETENELFALFERIGVFLFLFPEGLTARRSSVIACLQSGRPVVVSAPRSPDEFAHHEHMRALIEAGVLSFVPRSGSIPGTAARLLAAATEDGNPAPELDVEAWWTATTTAVRAAFRP